MIYPDDLAKAIHWYPVLSKLPASLQHAFSTGSYGIQAEGGEILIDGGAPADSFLMPLEGSLHVLYPGPLREFLLYRVNPGEVCILTAIHLLTGSDLPMLAKAESALRGVAVPQLLFRQMVELSPLFSSFLFHTFGARLAGLLELLGEVTTQQLDQRLAGLLLSKGSPISTTHLQLASEMGSVREVISRILKDFEKKGLLKLERGQIVILDPDSLTHLYRFGDDSH